MESTTPKKLIAISDIHGRYDSLRNLVDENYLINGYKFVFMGDYFGYGKQSLEVVEYLTYLKMKYGEQVILLYGNWEDMIEQALWGETQRIRDNMVKILYSRGFGETFKQIKFNPNNLRKVTLFIKLLNGKTTYIENDYCFVHAGVNVCSLKATENSLDDIILCSSIEDLLWIDFIENASFIESKYKFVVGHLPIQNIIKEMKFDKVKPYISGCAIGIDFGASKNKGYLGYIKFDEDGKRSYRKVPSTIK